MEHVQIRATFSTTPTGMATKSPERISPGSWKMLVAMTMNSSVFFTSRPVVVQGAGRASSRVPFTVEVMSTQSTETSVPSLGKRLRRPSVVSDFEDEEI